MFNVNVAPPRVSQALSIQAPVGGLNDLDPIASMGDSFLIDSMNFYPDTGLLTVRPGYQEWVTGIPENIKTIMSYNGVDGSFQIFGAGDTSIYPLSIPYNNPPAIAATGGNGVFIDTNYANAAGQFLIAVNGFKTLFFNGAAWGQFTQVPAPAAPGEITGVNPDNFSYVLVHKGRLWFIEKGTMTAWYLPIDAMGGEAKPFFVGGLFKHGGFLVMMARWSSDTGDGLDDRIVFISSMGEIASYSGDDPSDANDWSLDAVYYIAPPLSLRSAVSYGGDVLYLSRRGLVPLSSLISSSITEILYSNTLTRRISRTLVKLAAQQALPYPVEIAIHPDSAWIAISVYDLKLQKPIQLVMNFLTGAWGKFDYPVTTTRTVDRAIYMATGDGRVVVVTSESYVDNVLLDGTGGSPIEAYAFGAYTYLGDPTTNKHAKLMRPVFQTEVKPAFRMRALPDFRQDPYGTNPPPAVITGSATWDEDEWDDANWSGYDSVYRPWVSANVIGYAFAWQLRASTASRFGLAAVEWVWESGGLV